MRLFSATVGMTNAARLEIFDIVFHLATSGTAQTDNPADLTKFNKSYVLQGHGFGCERDHSQFVVFKACIDPDERSIPIELFSEFQRNAVTCKVG